MANLFPQIFIYPVIKRGKYNIFIKHFRCENKINVLFYFLNENVIKIIKKITLYFNKIFNSS